ncbi:MAG TPA: EAL domain-containing protein [Gemmatimonadota bacterium]|nr:EAL domain-containing protein [Gemmatimonadota bacterium]
MPTGLESSGHFVARMSAIPTFTVAVLLLGLGVLTLERERRSPEARAFFLVTAAAGVWMFGFSWMYLSADRPTALAWMRVAYLGVPLIAPSMYHFAVRILGIEERRRTVVRGAWAYFGGCSAVFVVTDLFVTGVHLHPWGPYPRFGPWSALFVVPFAGLLGLTLLELWRAWRTSEHGARRQRSGAFLAAFVVGDLALVDVLPALGVPVYPVGFAALVGFVLLSASAIWRYRLADLGPAFAAEAILQTVGELVALCDREGRIRHANPALCTLAGVTAGELLGVSVTELAASGTSRAALEAALGTERVTGQEVALLGRDGEEVPVRLSASALRDEHDDRLGTALVARDVREERRLRAELARSVFHDETTDLANRALLLDRIRLALSRTRRTTSGVALACVLLDGFERVVHGLGREAGRELLARVGERVGRAAQRADAVARSGEAEFVVLLSPGASSEEAVELAGRIEEALEPPVTLDGRAVFPSASFGVALSDDETRLPEDLLRAARAAATRARLRERRRIQVYAPGLREEAASSLEMEAGLRRALENGEFALHYQPIVRLADMEVLAFEALLRWNHPHHGVLRPGRFLPAARAARLLPRVGGWVIHEACRQLAEWRSRFQLTERHIVHVNLSAQELVHPDLLDRLGAALDRHGLEAHDLALEVTESGLLDQAEGAIGIVDALRSRGFRLCADDFGTGRTPLSYLGQFPLDMLKVDAAFVRSARARNRSASILEAVLDLARSLEMVTLAEGIETSAQLEQLRKGGCGLGQGYLLAPPQPAWRISRRLTVGRRLTTRSPGHRR